jgi:hypothetical protein
MDKFNFIFVCQQEYFHATYSTGYRTVLPNVSCSRSNKWLRLCVFPNFYHSIYYVKPQCPSVCVFVCRANLHDTPSINVFYILSTNILYVYPNLIHPGEGGIKTILIFYIELIWPASEASLCVCHMEPSAGARIKGHVGP